MLWTKRGAALLGTAALVTTLAANAAEPSHTNSQRKVSQSNTDRPQSAPAAAQINTATANETTAAKPPIEVGTPPAIDRSTHYSRTFEPPVTPPTKGENIARTALAYRGVPYRFGGRSERSGFDCSGLVQTVCAKWGIYLPRVAGAQFTRGIRIKPEALQPGDLVFFQGTYKRGLSHVGIFIGDGHFVHAAGYRKGVRISSLDDAYYQHHWAGARRLDLNALPKTGNEPAFTAREITVDSPEEAPAMNTRYNASPRSNVPPSKEAKSHRSRPEEHSVARAILEETITTGPREATPGLR